MIDSQNADVLFENNNDVTSLDIWTLMTTLNLEIICIRKLLSSWSRHVESGCLIKVPIVKLFGNKFPNNGTSSIYDIADQKLAYCMLSLLFFTPGHNDSKPIFSLFDTYSFTVKQFFSWGNLCVSKICRNEFPTQFFFTIGYQVRTLHCNLLHQIQVSQICRFQKGNARHLSPSDSQT